jgi:hypothetical protein
MRGRAVPEGAALLHWKAGWLSPKRFVCLGFDRPPVEAEVVKSAVTQLSEVLPLPLPFRPIQEKDLEGAEKTGADGGNSRHGLETPMG